MVRRLNARGWLPWLAALGLVATVAACGGGGGGDPILGFFSTPRPPTITAVAPPNGATGVALNNAVISADFSEPMEPITGSASFVLTCAAPCVSPAGTVSLDAARRIASFTLAPGTALAPLTVYTATITGARSTRTGLTLVAPYVWRFTTLQTASADTTRPRVAITIPATSTPGPTTGVPTNSAVMATFTEDMAPGTISPASFTVTCAAPCVAPAGTVNYVVGDRTAVFAPAAALAPGATYTVTVTSAATDLAGNALAGNQAPLPAASNYVWTFSTATGTTPPVGPGGPGGPVGPSPITVDNLNLGGAFEFCRIGTIDATFEVPSGMRMNPATVNAANFTVSAPGGVDVAAASVVLDAGTGRIARFTPQAGLTPGVTYTAHIRGGVNGVRDLAVPANALPADFARDFVVGACVVGAAPVARFLLSASTFGVFGNTGVINQGLLTVISGDAGTTSASTTLTGLHDSGAGCTYTETGANTGLVNAAIYTAPPPPTVGCAGGTAYTLGVATQAQADAQAAYNSLAAQAAGPDPGAGNLANLVLTPGTYTAAGGAFLIQGGNLTLNGQGSADATWVFQMTGALTVGGPGAAFPSSVTLINGAQAKNVYWQVGTTATVNAGGGGTMVGTILSQGNAAISSAGAATTTTLNGRVFSLGGTVTLVDTVVNVPAP